MAYTDTWDAAFNNAPAGGAQVSGGDDAIRQLKLAIYERLFDLVNDLNVDPVTLKASALGTVGAQTNRILVFGPNIMEAVNDEDDARHEEGRFQLTDPGLTGYGTLYLPHGITLKSIEAAMDRGLGTDCSLEFYKYNYTTGVKTVIDTVLRAAAGLGVSAGAGFVAEDVDSTLYTYGVRFFGTAAPFAQHRFYALRLTVDTGGVGDLP